MELTAESRAASRYARSMKKTLLCCSALIAFGLCFASSLSAQTPPATPSVQDPMSTWLRNAYRSNRNYLARTAEKVPEDLYTLRPGAQTDVRTLGQIIGHVANFNFLWCSQAKGERNPAQGRDYEKETSKSVLVQAINDALVYCDGAYAALTDASGQQMLTITQENGRQTQSLRMSLLTLNYGHNNEHYGNLVTLMRMKSIVPPSSEPR